MKPLERLLDENPSALDIRVHLKEIELQQKSRQRDLDVLAINRQLNEKEAIFARKDGGQKVLSAISREAQRIESEYVVINNDLRHLSRTRVALTYLLRRVEVLEREDPQSSRDLVLRFRKSPLRKAIDSAEIEDEAFRRILGEALGESRAAADQDITRSAGVVLTAAPAGKRESVLDRKIHLEEEIFTALPEAARLCEGLLLSKRRINIGDCELYLEEEGEGMPLVLLHGGPGCTHHVFHPWFSRARDYARVIYYDQRGCGLSGYEAGKDGYSVDQAAADLDALRNALGIDRWVVLGHSYGGALAQYYALKYPDRLAGLILVGALPGMWCSLKPGRQFDFLSMREKSQMTAINEELNELAKEGKWPYAKYEELVVYNNFLNGDWKRQNFYKPSRESIARKALYEWQSDQKNYFRSRISNSINKIDMTGAFVGCPIPTLIMEGQWDLTWNNDKPDVLKKNHPGAKLERFENAGHNIYGEDSDGFFSVIQDFIGRLPQVSPAAVMEYKNYLAQWEDNQKASPLHIVRSAGYGRSSMERLAAAYKREWCDGMDISSLRKLGFAKYDAAQYQEAHYIFCRMQQKADEEGHTGLTTMALIWQGHMLDLLGKRTEAIGCYKAAAIMCLKDLCTHDQYRLTYRFSPYAVERMFTPFVRVENQDED
jgi:proline iminopeptidase